MLSRESHRLVLRKGAEGPFTRIAFPGAPSTLATGIDDRGRIAGIYVNPDPSPGALGAAMRWPAALSAPMPRLLPGLLADLRKGSESG